MEAMTKIVQRRIDEMLKENKIKKAMQNFSTAKEANDWLIKVAIATLIR